MAFNYRFFIKPLGAYSIAINIKNREDKQYDYP